MRELPMVLGVVPAEKVLILIWICDPVLDGSAVESRVLVEPYIIDGSAESEARNTQGKKRIGRADGEFSRSGNNLTSGLIGNATRRELSFLERFFSTVQNESCLHSGSR